MELKNDDKMTRVYHITGYPDESAYMFFYGCNWDCDFCILKKYLHDIHVDGNFEFKIKFLTINDIMRILIENKIKEVFLGGGEPTLDPELEQLILYMKDNKIKVNVLTNGELLNERIVSHADSIAFSIKAINEEKHIRITHRSNRKSLENLRKLYNEKFRFETVLIKDILDCDNVLEIVNFLKSFPGKIYIRIDPVIPINERFVRPDDEYINECIKKLNDEKIYAYTIKSRAKTAKVLYPLDAN